MTRSAARRGAAGTPGFDLWPLVDGVLVIRPPGPGQRRSIPSQAADERQLLAASRRPRTSPQAWSPPSMGTNLGRRA